LIFVEAQLDGVSYEISKAENGETVWNDRDRRFSNLPSYLVGTSLFKVPHKLIPQGTVIKITVQNPSTIYIAHEDEANGRSGGFENSLANSGWTLVNDNAGMSAGKSWKPNFKYVWKKVVSTNGPTTVTLPGTTTSETVHSIFVRGNSFVKNYSRLLLRL
jgi:hypothetical protein